jgi:hypothetical protein
MARVKKSRGIKTMAMISRQVRTEEMFGNSFLQKKVYTGLNRLESRKERTRIDQKGNNIFPRKKIEMKKTRRKYFTPIGLISLDGSECGGVEVFMPGDLLNHIADDVIYIAKPEMAGVSCIVSNASK